MLFQLKDPGNRKKFELALYSGIKDEHKNTNLLLVPANDELRDTNNIVLPMSEIHEDLENFIKVDVPFANITPNNGTDIPVDRLERLMKKMEDLRSEIETNKRNQVIEKQNLREKLLIAEREKSKDRNNE